MPLRSHAIAPLLVSTGLALTSCKSSTQSSSNPDESAAPAQAAAVAEPEVPAWTEFAAVTVPSVGALDRFIGTLADGHPVSSLAYSSMRPNLFGPFRPDDPIHASIAINENFAFSARVSLPVTSAKAFFDANAAYSVNWALATEGEGWTYQKVSAWEEDGKLLIGPTAFRNASWQEGLIAESKVADANKLLAGHLNLDAMPIEFREAWLEKIDENLTSPSKATNLGAQYKQTMRTIQLSRIIAEGQRVDASMGVFDDSLRFSTRVLAYPETSMAEEYELNKAVRSPIFGLAPTDPELLFFDGRRVHLTEEELAECPTTWRDLIDQMQTQVRDNLLAKDEEAPELFTVPEDVMAFLTDTMCRADFDPQGLGWITTASKTPHGAIVWTSGAGADAMLAKAWESLQADSKAEKEKKGTKGMSMKKRKLKDGSAYYEFKMKKSKKGKADPFSKLALGMAASTNRVVVVGAKKPRPLVEDLLARASSTPEVDAPANIYGMDLLALLRLFDTDADMADLVERLEGKNIRVETRTLPVNGAMQRDIDLAVEGLASLGLVWDWYQAKKAAEEAKN